MKLLRRLAVMLLVIGLAACNASPNSAGQISERIGQIANDPASREFDLSTLMTFGWDRVYFFKAGTSRQTLCDFIQADRHTCGQIVRYEVVPADHVAMLFAREQYLTHAELHALSNGVFDFAFDGHGLAKAACVFRVRHGGGSPPVAYLEPKSL